MKTTFCVFRSLLITATVQLALLVSSSQKAEAYPELIRHGYSNCVSCHVNLGGGGVLNEYGRALSLEALSTWGSEEEAKTAYGLFAQPEWLNSAVEVRGLSMAIDQPQALTLRSILMQADLEGAVTLGNFTVLATAGYLEAEDAFVSRRHFAQYRISDTLAVRAGKFFPVFGLMNAEHASFVRQRNGFDQSQESYNLEASYVGEAWSAFLAGILASTDRALYEGETGISASASRFFGNRFKLGASILRASSEDGVDRTLGGIHAALGFTSRFFYLGELDLTRVSQTDGWSSYQKLDYEPIQGVHFFVTDEFTDPDRNSEGYTHRYGPGFQFFPRPHVELQLQAQWQTTSNIPNADATLITGMLNYYL
jgi:hypothetical protein